MNDSKIDAIGIDNGLNVGIGIKCDNNDKEQIGIEIETKNEAIVV